MPASNEQKEKEQDSSELSEVERRQISAESQGLLHRATARKNTMRRQAQLQPPAPSPMSQTSQATPPPVAPPTPPAPPPAAPVQAQVDENQPMVPPAGPGAPTGQGVPPAITPVAPPASAAGAPNVQAAGIEQYVDEKEHESEQPVSDAEAGFRNPMARRYASVYGHLKIRATQQRMLEVFDPVEPKRALLSITPNRRTRADVGRLKTAASLVLVTIADQGLARTAELWKGQLSKTADSIVDNGTTVMADPPEVQPRVEGTTGDGDSVNRGTDYAENGVTSTTSKGDGLTVTAPHDKRTAPGLSGKSAAQTGGVQTNTETNMADGPKPEASQNMDSRKDMDSTNREKPAEPKENTLEDAVNVFADESLTGKSKSAQAKPPTPGPVPPGPMPEGGEDAPLDEVEARYKAFYQAKAKRDIRAGVERFIARFTRCAGIAVRRQALNLESSPVKVAMADALMTAAQVSANEDYTGMDARTASFCIESGLNQDSLGQMFSQTMRRAAVFMKMSDEALDQVEQDLDEVAPVSPQAQLDPGAFNMPPAESQMDPTMMGNTPDMGMPMAGQADPTMGVPPMPMQGQEDESNFNLNSYCPQCGAAPGVPCDCDQQGDDEGAFDYPEASAVYAQDAPPPPMPPAPPVQARANSRREAARAGNMPVNTGAAGTASVSTRGQMMRANLRQALQSTRSAGVSRILSGQ